MSALGVREHLFTVDWCDIAFLHIPVETNRLQPLVRRTLDQHDGMAWVSLALFTQRRLRLRWGGTIGQWLIAPIASHTLCNLRTYVRDDKDDGILFLAEWIPNRLACLIGPRTVGLPYFLGSVDLNHRPETGHFLGRVTTADGGLAYHAHGDPDSYGPADSDLDRFLIERYAAWCPARGCRSFRIDHAPWPVAPATVNMLDRSLLDSALPIARGQPIAAAHVGPGVVDVRISRPYGARLPRLQTKARPCPVAA